MGCAYMLAGHRDIKMYVGSLQGSKKEKPCCDDVGGQYLITIFYGIGHVNLVPLHFV
jgi:hypothetical protein